MRKAQWMQSEIAKWESEEIIGKDTANILTQRYAAKKNSNLLILVFSIIGTLLIGTGVIMLGAKNWYNLPLFVRAGIAFLPLVASQALAVYVLKKRYDSAAWREGAAILSTAAVFTVVAMVGQIFHLPGQFDAYLLICGLLSAPMIYILNAASPLLVYYWTIVHWAASTYDVTNTAVLLVLFLAGALFVMLNSKKTGHRLTYMMWITVIAGFAVTMTVSAILDGSMLLAALAYFTLLLSVPGLREPLDLPFNAAGVIGSLVTLSILTYRDMWYYHYADTDYGFSAMIAVMLIGAIWFAAKNAKRDKLRFAYVVALALACILRFLWMGLELDYWPYEFILMLVSNAIMLAAGVGFIAHGAKNISLLTTNIGMAAICTLIVMRFFDSSMDFLWRGIVFVLLGAGFLLINLRILHIRKKQKQEVAK